jgi:hypothetical protein
MELTALYINYYTYTFYLHIQYIEYNCVFLPTEIDTLE